VIGSKLAYEYCDAKKIPYQKCGKLIVAINQKEELALKDLWEV
jgi:2-hydroxyglutarate dehydrogenase